ncbi:MAG: EMC3/TMCO1 family protein [Candidatus Heimdallarchaeota archaeon]
MVSLDPLRDALIRAGLPLKPPGATIFVILFSSGLSLFIALLSRYMIDVDELKRYTQEIKQYQDLLKKSKQTANRKLAVKLKRREAYIQRIQRKMMSQRFKPMAIYFIPLIIMFYVLRGIYPAPTLVFAEGTKIATGEWIKYTNVLPFKIPGHRFGTAAPWDNSHTILSFVWFYFMVSLTIGSVIQKMLGLTPE